MDLKDLIIFISIQTPEKIQVDNINSDKSISFQRVQFVLQYFDSGLKTNIFKATSQTFLKMFIDLKLKVIFFKKSRVLKLTVINHFTIFTRRTKIICLTESKS